MVRQLVAQLDDDQLDNQVRFERYEKERRRQEAAKRAVAINISDEEQSSEQMPDKAVAGTRQPNITKEEQPKEEHLKHPETMGAGQHQSEEQRPAELEITEA